MEDAYKDVITDEEKAILAGEEPKPPAPDAGKDEKKDDDKGPEPEAKPEGEVTPKEKPEAEKKEPEPTPSYQPTLTASETANAVWAEGMCPCVNIYSGFHPCLNVKMAYLTGTKQITPIPTHDIVTLVAAPNVMDATCTTPLIASLMPSQ